MLKTYRIIPLAFILFLFGFTLITGSTAFALNAKICEGDEAFNTSLQNSQPDDWNSKFMAMKNKMICMRGAVKVSGSKPSECAAINPGTTSDPRGKFNLMTDKMKCYKVLLPTAAEAQAVADAQPAETVNSQGAEDEVLETAFALNAKICEGDEAFNTSLQNSQPYDWMNKFKAMKNKMICMREAVVKFKGPTSQPECAAINPGTISDSRGKFNLMTDKMKCYKVLLPTETVNSQGAEDEVLEPEIAMNAKICEGDEAFNTSLQNSQPDDWNSKFMAMKDKMICMRDAVFRELRDPLPGNLSLAWTDKCAATNPEKFVYRTPHDFQAMQDKMTCYKVLLPTAAETQAVADAQAAAEAQSVADAQAAAEAQAVADAQPVQKKIMYGYCVNRCLSDNPTEACTEKCVTTDIVSIEKLQVVIKKQPGVKCYQYTGLACLERFDLSMKSLLTIP